MPTEKIVPCRASAPGALALAADGSLVLFEEVPSCADFSGAVEILLLANHALDAVPQLDGWSRSVVSGAVVDQNGVTCLW
eukprot:s2872_g9.t1